MTAFRLYNFFRLTLPAILLLLLSGCASVHEMSLTSETETLDLKGKALMLMSLQLKHDYKPKFQPDVAVVHVETHGADAKEDRHNFKIDQDGTISKADGTLYLLRMELEPGQYVLRGATALYQGFPIIGACMMPIHGDIEAKANTVTYLGRAKGITRKRQEGEFRSGALIPLIDQAVSGFSKSTFDVELSDQREEDIKAFRLIFPALHEVEIDMDILPPFDRQRAQIWWESDGARDVPTEKTHTSSVDEAKKI